MNADNWYHSDGQQTFGPLPEDQIIALIRGGQLNGDHFVLPEGSEDWQPVRASPFASHLSQTSPALEQPQRTGGVAPVRQQRAAAPVRSPRPQTASHGAAKAHQGLNRNLLILGSLTLMMLGGLGFFLIAKKGGNIFNTKTNVTNQITNNSYFTQLIASGATTEKDLEAVTGIRPYGNGFIGISKAALTWEKSQDLARRTGAQVLLVEDSAEGSRQQLIDWFNTTFKGLLGSTVWVRENGQAKVLGGRDVLSVTSLENARMVGLQWIRTLNTPDSNNSSTNEEGFVRLDNGKDLSNWQGAVDSYEVIDGHIVCKQGKIGNLLSKEEYGNMILRFEFKLPPAGNNGIALRTPMGGRPEIDGLEIQVLDTDGYEAKTGKSLLPNQVHGSIYGLVAAQRGPFRPTGEWNTQEIEVRENVIKVTLNGRKILDVNLDTHDFSWVKPKPAGIVRRTGHVGFAGHKDPVAFRNFRVKRLSENAREFTALFNGKDLAGFRGGNTVDPRKLAAMPEAERSAQIAKWTASMRDHWRVENGELINDGKGDYATTEKEFGDFELVFEYRTVPGADSGILLRGYPQVQIWDFTQPDDPRKPGRSPNLGSGGLWNNSIGTPGRDPLVKADKPFGEWNKLRIFMVGDQVSVWLNDRLVVDRAVLQNYFDRSTPIAARGPIQFQTFNGEIRFRNILIREIGRDEAKLKP